MKRIKKVGLVAIISVSAVVFAACAGTSNQEQEVKNQPEPTISSANESVEPVQEYDISMSNYSFSETTLVVKAGEEVTINLTNNKGNHDLVIDELDVHSKHLGEGQSEQLIFTVSEEHVGQTYEFYCSVGSHRQFGMVGTIQII